MSGQMLLEHRPEDGLLIARWNGPGYEEDFPNEGREILIFADVNQCWRWLLDYRVHGDTSDYNARDFVQGVLFDAKGRIRQAGEKLKVALLLGPNFTVLPKHLPAAELQERRRIEVQVFTEEGLAREWLLQE